MDSIGDVLEDASPATEYEYVGAVDLAAVDSPRALTPLETAPRCSGCGSWRPPVTRRGTWRSSTPTQASWSQETRWRTNGGLSGSNPRFTEDPAAAAEWGPEAGRLALRTVLVGHRQHVVQDAAAVLEALASPLG